MDKTKQPPVPDQKQIEKEVERKIGSKRSTADPRYIRGTIDPTLRK